MDDDSLVGQVVAHRYKVLRKMGEGGMGTVYLAEHMAIEKKVALKVLLQEYARKADLKERFLQEARAAAKIAHENIVDIFDFGETPDRSVFFAMEFLEGDDLSQALKKSGAMEWSRAKPILVQICRALGAAHSKGVIHRDMKPENIFLVEREGRPDTVKVLDFGIAKVSGMGDGERRLTRTGMIFGTPEYMSPEQAQGHKPDHRVDIYAVGVIMYEMLTGRVPFKADTFMGILTKHIFEAPLPPSEVRPGIAADTEELVLTARAKDREERFRSMAEMAAAITRTTGRVPRATGDAVAVPRRVTAAPVQRRAGAPVVARDSGGPLQSLSTNDEIVNLPSNTGRILYVMAALLILVSVGIGAYALLRDNGDGDGAPVAKAKAKHGVASGAAAAGAPAKRPTQDPAATTPATPVVPARSSDVSITVQSEPIGADIYLGRRLVGKTDGENNVVKLARSSTTPVELTLRKPGYRNRVVQVVPAKDRALRVELERESKVVTAVKAAPTAAVRPSSKAKAKPKTKPKHKAAPKRPPTKGSADPSFGRSPELIDPF